MKPIIAITADIRVAASEIINERRADFAPRGAVDAVLAAGGLPIVLPYTAPELVEELVRTFDGLIIPGGPDVDPTFFGEEPIPEIGRTYYKRDAFEIALIKATIAAQKPIFGICRGIQIINVAMGGTVFQDLATQDPTCRIRHAQAAPGEFPTHHVMIEPNSYVASILKTSRSYVNSRHHQAVRKVAVGLTVSAQSDDQVIEAVESTQNSNIVAVQWHPENMWQEFPEQLEFFKDLVHRSQPK
ncbi:gamma-glutamyl-gamma-aminobutyrate hydrolase family protein [Pediococcus ethanolidurans]|uniref:Glutamine amidotransferase n=1 Tax=Pediococcus ethanolidurans TaxID=319653 RepID=A0A0R2K5H4_9LACO|nr:gamma-glutamyl-gamma-aminobutyrate hydrolase family protein [Pediococcus ethanolidurans]KRN83094.1 glutamine amidotransferase [Pediococcus ethanolidurans]GEN95079.1 gamma-glutamyl-gamma-aminobutyrate hydrolase [Pediococcus ethanolidurans]SER36082.1 putative glutamine amidotransferase [Pediococcus ethanolidurans]